MTLKGIVVGTLLFVAVEAVLLFRSISRPPGVQGTVGYDLLTLLHNVGVNGPMFWITLVVFVSICSQLFQRGQ